MDEKENIELKDKILEVNLFRTIISTKDSIPLKFIRLPKNTKIENFIQEL